MSERTQGGKVTTFDPGVIARISQAVSYVVRGVTPSTWFGPGQAPLPAAPKEAEGRAFDYRFGINTTYRPRAEEAITFEQLRMLAEYDLVRMAIETCKNQIERVPFNIKPRGEFSLGGKPGQKAEGDPRIDKIEAFLSCPDGEHDWATWLKALLEDMFVLDAATIYPRLTNGGDLYALEIVDGATIKRVVDENGRTPAPPSVAYQQIIKGLPATDYSRDTLIYRPRNYRSHKLYGFSPVEQIVMSINIGLRREMAQMAYFTEGNMSDTLIGTPAGWTSAQVKDWQGWWDSQMAGNSAARAKGRFVPGEIAGNLHQIKQPPLKDEFDEWIARLVCYAFNLPPTAFVKQNNRATAESAADTALRDGMAPLLLWVKSVMDSIIARYFGCPDLEFAWGDEKELDPKVAAYIDGAALERGALSRDEYRAKRGQDPLPDGMGAVYTISSGASVVRLEDAIKEPEPTPPALIGHNGGPALDDKGNLPAPGGAEDAESDPADKSGEAAKFAPVPFSKGTTPI